MHRPPGTGQPWTSSLSRHYLGALESVDLVARDTCGEPAGPAVDRRGSFTRGSDHR